MSNHVILGSAQTKAKPNLFFTSSVTSSIFGGAGREDVRPGCRALRGRRGELEERWVCQKRSHVSDERTKKGKTEKDGVKRQLAKFSFGAAQ